MPGAELQVGTGAVRDLDVVRASSACSCVVHPHAVRDVQPRRHQPDRVEVLDVAAPGCRAHHRDLVLLFGRVGVDDRAEV